MTSVQSVAKTFKALHLPGKPVLLANVYDATSARIVGSLPQCTALASASYAVAEANGTADEDLPFEKAMAAARDIAAVARELNKPLTVDFQDGYGDRLEEGITMLVEYGVVGVNLEDADQKTGEMFGEAVATQRVRRVVETAKSLGVPDFVVNARSDAFWRGATMDESIRRGKLYLEAGATTVFIFHPAGVSEEDIRKAVRELDGRLAISLNISGQGPQAEGRMTSRKLAELGVARVSVGPQIWRAAAEAIRTAAGRVFD